MSTIIKAAWQKIIATDEEYVETAAELLAGLFLRQVQHCQERKGAKTKGKRSLKDKS